MRVLIRHADDPSVIERAGEQVADLLDESGGDIEQAAASLYASGFAAGVVEITARMVELGVDVHLDFGDGP